MNEGRQAGLGLQLADGLLRIAGARRRGLHRGGQPDNGGGQAARDEGGQPFGEAFDEGPDLVLGAVR